MSTITKDKSGTWRAPYRDPEGKQRSKNFKRRRGAELFLTSVEHTGLLQLWLTSVFSDQAASLSSLAAHANSNSTGRRRSPRLHVCDRGDVGAGKPNPTRRVTSESNEMAPTSSNRGSTSRAGEVLGGPHLTHLLVSEKCQISIPVARRLGAHDPDQDFLSGRYRTRTCDLSRVKAAL